jgi:SAM-dependent MidA family methyltransferase
MTPNVATPPSLTSPLNPHMEAHIREAIEASGGWLAFDRFMEMALYTPHFGYYANDSRKFGTMPAGVTVAGEDGGGDFVTAPEMSPYFGRALAAQVQEALQYSGTREVWEFGAGSGALAAQLLVALGEGVERYTIVDLSDSLRELQRMHLSEFAGKVQWVTELPAQMTGVVVGNEVLDAMPVKLLVRLQGVWHERGVVVHDGALHYGDQPTGLRPPVEVEGAHDYVTEIHQQAEGFVRTLADRLNAGGGGAAFFIDYGFPELEYYHPQRSMGTVMCHRGHLADPDALSDVGSKDITAHVNFTGIALAGQEAGFRVAGYASQGRFLLNCGLLYGLENVSLSERVMVQRLVNEHEMGELFKVIAFEAGESKSTAAPWVPMGFAVGDRMHTL